MLTLMTHTNSVNKRGRCGFPRKMSDNGVLTAMLYKILQNARICSLEIGYGMGNEGMDGKVLPLQADAEASIHNKIQPYEYSIE